MNRGWGLYVGPNATTNNFILANVITPFEWFEVGDIVGIGTTKWGSEIAYNVTITNKYDNGDGTYTVVFDGSAVYLEVGGRYIHKKVEEKMFTIYTQPFVNPEVPLDDSYIVGGISYTNYEAGAGSFANYLKLYTLDGGIVINSDSYLSIENQAGNLYIHSVAGVVYINGGDNMSTGDIGVVIHGGYNYGVANYVSILKPILWQDGNAFVIYDAGSTPINGVTSLLRIL